MKRGSGHRYQVDISGGKGAVVGDYATVFQVFAQSPPALSSFIRAPQFRSLVDERVRKFVGRDFVFKRIEQLIGGAEFQSGYVTVRGEPGIGKTAIAASLVARHGYVHHFNIAPQNIRSPRQFLENVCAQLIVRYELKYTTLPPAASEDAGFLSQLLSECSDRAREMGNAPVVVVVDALDESENRELPASANCLYLPRALPDGVFFILTTREKADYRLDVDNESEIWIRENDPGNQKDVIKYIERFVETDANNMAAPLNEWGLTRKAFVAELATLAEGNFMYLVHVLPEIARGRLRKQTVGAIDALPRGLKSYYQRHWRDMKAADETRFATLQRPVLCFLAISREPVTVIELVQWTNLEPGDVMGVIREWREFLNDDGTSAACYRIYHRSFAEFLDEEENLRFYHDRIGQTALAKLPGLLMG
jgi:hypothetical protein